MRRWPDSLPPLVRRCLSAPASKEVASLRIREADACWHANKVKEKFAALADRACLDAVEFGWLWKEWEELLLAVEGLHRERNVAHQQHTAAQLQIGFLEGKLEKEKGLRIKATGATVKLTVEVGQC
jgi:hypothetical protein